MVENILPAADMSPRRMDGSIWLGTGVSSKFLMNRNALARKKVFRSYLSLTWGLLEALHEVPNPYNKTPQPIAWVISMLTNLGTFSNSRASLRSGLWTAMGESQRKIVWKY